MIDKARQAVSALEMSAVKDMSVEKAEELREIVYQALDQAEKNEHMQETIKTSVIATPNIKTIETPVGTFYKVELAFNEEELKRFKEWLENEIN